MRVDHALLCGLFCISMCSYRASADEINVNHELAERLKAKGWTSGLEQAIATLQIERRFYGGGGPYEVTAQSVKATAGEVVVDSLPVRVVSETLKVQNCAPNELAREDEVSNTTQLGNSVEIEDSINTTNTVSANIKGVFSGVEIGAQASNAVVVNHRQKGTISYTTSDTSRAKVSYKVPAFTTYYVRAVRTTRKAYVPFTTTVIVDGVLRYFYKGQPWDYGLVSAQLSPEERTFRLKGSITNVSATETEL